MLEADANGGAREAQHHPVSVGKGRLAPGVTSAGGAAGVGRERARTGPDEGDSDCFLFAQQSGLVLAAQEQERRRIAGDLHDGMGPLLTLIRLELTQAAALANSGHDVRHELGPVIERAAAHVARAFDELRRTVANLRPAMLDDLGLLPTLGWLIREFEHSGAGVFIGAELAVRENDVPAGLRIVIFRICQEALNNVVRHAHARCAMLSLTRSAHALQLWIEDDGCGLPATGACLDNRTGGGLAGIQWRANGSGGRCEIGSEPGRGAWIRVTWPLGQRNAAHKPQA